MKDTTATSELQLLDADEVRRCLQYLLPAGCVAEVRALDASAALSDRWPHTASGYFDDGEKLVAELAGIRAARGIYITLNPVDPALLARAANRIRKALKGESTADSNIAARRWLLVDCDPVRPTGISATNTEHYAALDRAAKIKDELHYNYGWPDPLEADSGNGSHLLYRIDLPPDDGGLVQRCLATLVAQFTDEHVTIDAGVFNPARITKLYGTLVCKGDSTVDRPHRLSRILAAPTTLSVVSRELLEALADEAPVEAPKREQNGRHADNGQVFDIDEFLQRHGFELNGPAPYQGGRKWTFRQSPLCEHHDDGPFLIEFPSGASSAGCHHDSCTWKWQDVRAKFEPKPEFGLYERLVQNTQKDSAGNAHQQTDSEALLADLLPMSEFVRQSHHVEFLIPFAIVAGQPGVISARTKSLKTTIAIDANISMATATPFLGTWQVPSPIKCGILSAESGAATIAETIRRIATSKGLDPEAIENCLVSSRCPRLQSEAWLDEIRRVIHERELRCLTIDPTYMAAAGVKQNDLSSVASMLEPVTRIIGDTGCSILMVHHNRKVSEMRYGCPTLEEITGSGFAEWARFWLLLNRRREWDDVAGQHWLWLVTGGSAGFGSRKWLDVREGKPTDLGGRVWEVEAVAAGEGESREKQEREHQRKEQRESKVLDDQKAVVASLHKCGGKATKTDLRDRTGLNTGRLGIALAELLDRGDITPCTVTKGNNRSFEGYQLHD